MTFLNYCYFIKEILFVINKKKQYLGHNSVIIMIRQRMKLANSVYLSQLKEELGIKRNAISVHMKFHILILIAANECVLLKSLTGNPPFYRPPSPSIQTGP